MVVDETMAGRWSETVCVMALCSLLALCAVHSYALVKRSRAASTCACERACVRTYVRRLAAKDEEAGEMAFSQDE